jgi:hypothetical protein
MTTRLGACLECGCSFEFRDTRPREFCRARCRKRWNNRRMTRGAELYDLYMAHRFDRANAQELGVFQAINRLASNYRQEDNVERSGRRSWRWSRAVLEERPFLKAITVREGTGRRNMA